MAEPNQPEYLIRLSMQMPGYDASEAVTSFVDAMVTKGLRDWVYRVEDPITGELIGYYDGHGMSLDIAQINGIPAEFRPEPDEEADDEPATEPEQETDAELLAVAEQATAEGQ